MQWVRIVSLVTVMTIILPTTATAEALSVLLACGHNSKGELEVRQLDTTAVAFVRGVNEGDNCLKAYAELRGRLETWRREGAKVAVTGPRVAVLDPDAEAPGCDIWSFMSNGVSDGGGSECCSCAPICGCGLCPATPPATPVGVALLVCGLGPDGTLEVRFLDSSRADLMQGLETETSCAQARTTLLERFEKLGRRAGRSPTVHGPVPGKILTVDKEETLTFQYEVVKEKN